MQDIPPVFVNAEPMPPPDGAAFRKCPAEHIRVGDLVLLGVFIYRVKARRQSPSSPKLHFTLWPVAGGKPIAESWFPREWKPTVHQ